MTVFTLLFMYLFFVTTFLSKVYLLYFYHLMCGHLISLSLVQSGATCSKSANKLSTSCVCTACYKLLTCNNLVDIIRLVTRLFQQGCYNHDITILLQPCVVNLVTFLLYHDCIRLVRTTL